ncbi:DUF5665 domain-containing protein [Jannaschia pohangensis]|nr:DUF5665 domain-containing protein [Jannaschia pohangensis]
MPDERLHDEIAALRREVASLNSHRWLKVHNSFPRLIAFQLARGLAFGLGTVLGASALLSVLVWSLSQINFIPIIGDYAADIISIIQPQLEDDTPPAE